MVSSISAADQTTNCHHNPSLLVNTNSSNMYPTVMIQRNSDHHYDNSNTNNNESSSNNHDLIHSSNPFEFHQHSKSNRCHHDIHNDTMMLTNHNIDNNIDHRDTMNMMIQEYPINPHDIVESSSSSSMSSSLSSSLISNNNTNSNTNDIVSIMTDSKSQQQQKQLLSSSILLYTTGCNNVTTKQLIQLLNSSCIVYDIHVVSSTGYQSLILSGNECEVTLPGILLLCHNNHDGHVWIPHNCPTLLEKAREHMFTNQVVAVVDGNNKESVSLLSTTITMPYHDFHTKEHNCNDINKEEVKNTDTKQVMMKDSTTNTAASSFITTTTHRDSYNISGSGSSSSSSSITSSHDRGIDTFANDVMKQHQHNNDGGDSIKVNDNNDIIYRGDDDDDDDDDESLTLSTIFRMAKETVTTQEYEQYQHYNNVGGDSVKDNNDNDIVVYHDDNDHDDNESMTLSTIFRMAVKETVVTTKLITDIVTTAQTSHSRSSSNNLCDEQHQDMTNNDHNDHNNEGNIHHYDQNTNHSSVIVDLHHDNNINNHIMDQITLPNCSSTSSSDTTMTMTVYDMIRYLLKHMKHHCSKSLPNHHKCYYHTGSSSHHDDSNNNDDDRDYGYYYITGSEAITIWSKLFNNIDNMNHNNFQESSSNSDSISYNNSNTINNCPSDEYDDDDIVQMKKKQQEEDDDNDIVKKKQQEEQHQHDIYNIIDFGYELIQKGVLYCYNPNQYCTYHHNQDTNSTTIHKYQQFRSLYLVLQPLYQPYILNQFIQYNNNNNNDINNTNDTNDDVCSDDDLIIPSNYDDALLLLSKQKNHTSSSSKLLNKEQTPNTEIIDSIISLSSMMDQICNNNNNTIFDHHDDGPNENTELHTTTLYETFEMQVCQLQHMASIPTFLLPCYFRQSHHHHHDGNNNKDKQDLDDNDNAEVRIKFLLNLFNLMIRHTMILASDEYRNIPTIRSSSSRTNNTTKMTNDCNDAVERICYYLYEWPNQLHDVIPFFQRIKYTIGDHIISLYDIQCELFGLHQGSVPSSLFKIVYEESLLSSPDNDGNSGDVCNNNNQRKSKNNKGSRTNNFIEAVTSSKTTKSMSDNTYPKKDNKTSTNTLKKKNKRWHLWNLITSCRRNHHSRNDSVILDTFTSSGSSMVHHHNKLTDHHDVSNGGRSSHDGTGSSNFNNSNREYVIHENQKQRHQTVPISLSSQQNKQYYNSLGYRIVSNTNNIPYYRHDLLQSSYDKRIIMAMTWCTKDSPTSIRTIYQHEQLHDVLNEYCIAYCQNHLQIHQTNEIILLPTYLSFFRESFIYIPPPSNSDINNNDSHNKINHQDNNSMNHLAYFHHANIQPVDGTYQFIQSYISLEQQKQINDLLYENGYLDILFHHEYNWKRGLSYHISSLTSKQQHQDLVLTSFHSNHHKLSYRDFAESQTNVIDNCKKKDFEQDGGQHMNLIAIDEKQNDEQHQLHDNKTSLQHSSYHRHNMLTMNKNTGSSRKNYVQSDIVMTNGIGNNNSSNSTTRHMLMGKGRSKRRVCVQKGNNMNHSNHDLNHDDTKNGNNISRRRFLLRRGSSGGGLSYQSNSYISLTPPSLNMNMTMTHQTSMSEKQLLLLPNRNSQNHHYDDNNDFKYDDYYTSNDYDYDCDFTVTDLSVFTSS